jgi:hypothetical protein
LGVIEIMKSTRTFSTSRMTNPACGKRRNVAVGHRILTPNQCYGGTQCANQKMNGAAFFLCKGMSNVAASPRRSTWVIGIDPQLILHVGTHFCVQNQTVNGAGLSYARTRATLQSVQMLN